MNDCLIDTCSKVGEVFIAVVIIIFSIGPFQVRGVSV